MIHWKMALAGAALTALALPATAQDMIKVGTFVPEQSVGVSKVILPWMEAVAADTDAVKMQGFLGGGERWARAYSSSLSWCRMVWPM